jgi:predicted PhzF superfamily epimerase YddE/YHI9
MKIPIYHIDAFTSEIFSGNPAAVCLLDSWVDDKLLQSIAAENNQSETAFLVPNDNGFSALADLECRGVIITARGDLSDFVSRFFAPRYGIPEDPVTGSAHCVLTPYWAEILNRDKLHALQVSRRGGELFCTNAGNRVKISGKAVLYMEGVITV